MKKINRPFTATEKKIGRILFELLNKKYPNWNPENDIIMLEGDILELKQDLRVAVYEAYPEAENVAVIKAIDYIMELFKEQI